MDQCIVVMSERRIRDAERRERGDAKSDTAEEISAVGVVSVMAQSHMLPGATVTQVPAIT